jgi:hypothetical protein
MPGLILELQADALDRHVRISDLLRKTLVISKKLGISKIEHWIQAVQRGLCDDREVLI